MDSEVHTGSLSVVSGPWWKWPTFGLGTLLFAFTSVTLTKDLFEWGFLAAPLTLAIYLSYRALRRRCLRIAPLRVPELNFAFAPVVAATVVSAGWLVAVTVSMLVHANVLRW